MRAASLTAGPITVKSSRVSVPTLPYCTVPTCSAMSSPRVGIEQHGLNALDLAAPYRPGQHARCRIVAEIRRQEAVADGKQGGGLDRQREQRQQLLQGRQLAVGKAARPVRGKGADHPELG